MESKKKPNYGLILLILFFLGIAVYFYILNETSKVYDQINQSIPSNSNTVLDPSTKIMEVNNQETEQLGSQGLGLSIDEWDQIHIKGQEYGGFVNYDNNQFALMTSDRRISHLEVVWGDENALDFTDAKIKASKYIPYDSQLIEKYEPGENRIVERFSSQKLKPLFSEIAWLGSPPGEFIIIYRAYEFGVSSIVIALGNNP
jgi:hypothetical protein